MQGAQHDRSQDLPGWVPRAAIHYLEHTESGTSLRALAREAGCHPSTIMRQVRRIETRRDDPLVDAALLKLGQCAAGAAGMKHQAAEDSFQRDTQRILQRLCETGAVLAVAEGMEKAVVVRDTGDGGTARTAVVDTPLAEAMALREWIACDAPGRVSRYRITALGRQALGQIMARRESRLRGFAEREAGYGSGAEIDAQMTGQEGAARRRFSVAESPLVILARRRNPDGTLFIDDRLTGAGERLREDYELSGLDARAIARHISGEARLPLGPGVPGAALRFAEILDLLGPGLADVAVQCCCLLEGLETTEKRMGWSARSGKIVLRIALARLAQFYGSEKGRAAGMIG